MINKESNPALASTFYSLSVAELNHISMLHDEIVKMIKQYRSEHGEPPEGMIAVYNFLHEKQIGDVADIKRLHEQYKN